MIVCHITTKTVPWARKVALPDGGEDVGAVLVDQVKSLDAAARQIEDSGERVGDAILNEVLARLATLTA